MKKINVVIKRPGEALVRARVPGTWEEMQSLVGGYVARTKIGQGVAVLYNAEPQSGLNGRSQGDFRENPDMRALEHNCNIEGVSYSGVVVFVGLNGDRLSDFVASLIEEGA